MGPPGFEPAIDQRHRRGFTKPFNHMGPRDRMPATLEQDRLLLPVGLVPREMGGDLQHLARLERYAADAAQPWVARLGHAIGQRGIDPFDRMFRKLFSQALMRRVGFRDNQQAAGVLVDPVHDTGPFEPAHP